MRILALGTALLHLGADPCLGEEEVEEAFLLTTWLLEEEGAAVVNLHPYLVEVGVDGEAGPKLLEAEVVGSPSLEEGVVGVACRLEHSSLRGIRIN
jgi:hypothetical protein